MIGLPDKEPWLANALLNCLRRWERESGPGPWYVTVEDLDHLTEWIKTLDASWERTREFYREHNFPYQIRPVEIGDV